MMMKGPVGRAPRAGGYLHAFEPGAEIRHPHGLTLYPALAQEFAATFMQDNRLYLDEAFARECGFDGLVVPPLMVLRVTAALGVERLSEQAITHLGDDGVRFHRPVVAGTTVRARSQIVSRRVRGMGLPGVLRVRSRGFDPQDRLLIEFEREIVVPQATGVTLPEGVSKIPDPRPSASPMWSPDPSPILRATDPWTPSLVDFSPGQVILHDSGRAMTDEHIPWTYRLGSIHPRRFDQLYALRGGGALSGEPVVDSGLVFAWIAGLASRETSRGALQDLGYDHGHQTRPVSAGDTLFALSRVNAVETTDRADGAGVVSFTLVGLKNLTSTDAYDRYGPALFAPEREKGRNGGIEEKVFEVERRLLFPSGRPKLSD